MKTYSFRYVRTDIRFPVIGGALMLSLDQMIRVTPSTRDPPYR